MSIYAPKDAYKSVYSIVVHDSSRLETSQTHISNRMKNKLWYLLPVEWYLGECELINYKYNNINAPHKNKAEQGKLGTKEYVLKILII